LHAFEEEILNLAGKMMKMIIIKALNLSRMGKNVFQ